FVAILEPTYERLLKAALSTCFFGLNANQLHQLQSDEIAWNSRIEQFIDLRRLWANHGFVNAFRKLTVDEHLRPRIVQTASGERKLTNLLHLAELIHDAERENRFTPAGLIQWIRHQMEEMRTPSEAQFLRLERDEDAVQVVTVHKAKGLQYGIVFCPFHWTGKKSRETLFHDRNNENRLTLDLSGKEVNSDHNAQADEENLAEEIRLLYVGVTRAINRCYLYVAGIANKNPSPLEAVLVEESTFQDSLEKIVAQNPENIGLSTLHHVSGDSAPTPGNAEPVQELAWRAFSRKLPREGMVASFSGLTHTVSVDSSHQAIDPKDRDESEFISPLWNEGEKAPDYSIFGFPRGTAAGNALHAILEVADFANPSELPGQVQKALKAEGLDPAYAPAVIKQLHMLFQHPLNRGQDRFSLSQLGAGDRLTEVEFFFPIRRFWPSDLAHAYRLHPLPELPRQIDRLHFNPTDGYLRGFIDLIFRYQDRFYIADWKSNWLGDKTADYTPDKLSAAMVESSYHLQSHLYAVALDQYLRSRLPGYQFSKNFGGIVYFFIRGLDPEAPERGVHFESVDPQFLTGLKKQILRNTQVAQ
ncbi:MAG: PD-(D/E)XK nuclease family protein, partial [Verrucomicrobiae bacterium]|nr:PD-(D/E)XK nuclease family protein [Verrucomicrobiae bacterium]